MAELMTDRVCRHCDAILSWYPDVGYLHIRPNGNFYIADHKPEPKDSYEPEGGSRSRS